MDDKMIILAVHTKGKAFRLKQVLESRGIPVYLEELPHEVKDEKQTERFAIKVNPAQVSKALTIIEEYKLFSYNDVQTIQIDDGRKRILVAVDFSSYSLKACKVAFSIAKEINAKVKILHVFNNIYYPSHIPFADTIKGKEHVGLLDKSRRRMLDLCLEIDKNITEGKLPSVNYSYSLREGIIEEEVESFINEYKPMLLVLGTRGKNNNQKNILGSVTADLIEMTNVPVLAIPENIPFEEDVKNVKHIAFFTNIHKRDLMSFDYLVNHLLPYKGLKITLVHVVVDNNNDTTLTEGELMGLKEYFNQKYPGLDIECKLIGNNDIISNIKKFIEGEKVNIVTINTRRRNIWGRIFIPSNSRKMLASLDVALLTLRGDSFI